MLEKIECAFKDLISAVQIARLYPEWHPQFKKGIERAYLSLQEVLREKASLVLGIIGEELAFEKEIFFNLSSLVRLMILYLKERGVERIEFFQGLKEEELSKFVAFLVMPKDQVNVEPQKHLLVLGVKNIAVGKIKESSSGQEGAPGLGSGKPLSFIKLYEDSVDKISHALEGMLDRDEFDSFSVKFTVQTVMENLLGRHQDFLNLAVVKRYDEKTFFHMMNVSMLSMFFASRLGFTKEEVLSIGTAALFHDIGKLYISRKIIQKPDKLTEEEFSKIKSHTILGADFLLKYTDTLGILPVVVSFEHHLKYNLKGYPKLSFSQQPHIASMIVSICDVYDALSQKRNYKNDYPPRMIYEIMIREDAQAFDPKLLDKFFKIIGVWPVGTIVALTDSRIAVVREENEDDIFSPKVEVIFPADRKEMIDLKMTKEKNKIEHFLNPFKEGKDYLLLVYPEMR